MKYWKITLAILATVSVSLALAEDFKTITGKEYKNAKVSRVEPDGIVLIYKSGVAKVFFAELPKEVQRRFGYDPDRVEVEKAAARAVEEKRIDEQKTAERERAEREKNADAELKRSLEEFQAAEHRAAQAYQNATKGPLSGQVFVSARGGENFKLGAVKVSLFDRGAIDILVGALRNYADIKIQQLRPSLDAAKMACDQADSAERALSDAYVKSRYGDNDYNAYQQAKGAAHKARDGYRSVLSNVHFYYSGAFYFGHLVSPIQSAETDAEGKFAIQVPQRGAFVIAAQAERDILKEVELYYWLQPVALEGQQQSVQNLSNNNLTSTTGTSSLIHTQD